MARSMAIKPELFSSCITICTMEQEQEVENVENKFKSELYKRYNAGARHLIPKEKYFTTINDVKVAAAQRKDKSRYQYYILTRYEVLECGDVEKLIRRRKTPDDPIKYFITIEDTFDALKRAHIATGHGGRDRMRKLVSQKYDNLADTDIVLFKSVAALEERGTYIRESRKRAGDAQRSQAEKMVKRGRRNVIHGQIGDNVVIPIPMVDRGRCDPRNIVGIITDRNDNDMYTLAVKSGVLKNKYIRNQFDVCAQRLLTENDVDLNNQVSLREAVSLASSSGGQGFVKCNCAGKSRCESNRCKCYKAKVKCNSRCHNTLICKNK